MALTVGAVHNGFLVGALATGSAGFDSRTGVSTLTPRLIIQTAPAGGFAPLDPVATTIPRLDRSTPTHVYDAMSWLLDPAFSLQWASTSAIDRERAGLLQGRVVDRDTGVGLEGVEVSVVGRPEVGRTRTRMSGVPERRGVFELLVNGGGPILLRFRRDASTGGTQYLDAERMVDVSWNSWNHVDTVSMVPRARMAAASACRTMTSGLMMTGISSTSDSTRGQRQLGLYVPVGTTVTPSGAGVLPPPLGGFTWCLAEHTLEPSLGAGGPQAMGGTLPDTTGYTFSFAAEVHNGSTGTSSATRVTDPMFNQDVFGI